VQNVVQVITDNVANYVFFGRILMDRHHILFYTSCATHCIDFLLEDMGKLVEISKSIR